MDIHPAASRPLLAFGGPFSRAVACTLVYALAGILGCHRPAGSPPGTSPADDTVPGPSPVDVAIVPSVPPVPPAPWCFTPLPTADLRAIDGHGHVWSITHGRISDETAGVTTVLPDEIACPVRGGWGMEFAREGSAFALVDSRFYLRPAGDTAFRVTPMCSDVAGAPWSRRAEGGWSFVVRTWPASGPGMMLTNNSTGDSGWYAVSALDSTLTAAVLEPDRSMVLLANHGHLLFVDQTRHVAGEVLASHGALFSGLGRSAAGVVAFRDDGPTRRVLVTSGDSVQEPFTEVPGERPTGTPTRAVFRSDVARVLAVTDTSVELSTDRGAHFIRVLTIPDPLQRPTFGWLQGAHPALAVRQGLVTDHCLHTGDRDP